MRARLQQWLHRRLPARWLDNRLFIFCALGSVLGLMVILTSPFSGPSHVIMANLLTGLVLIGVSIAGLMGAPVRPLVHLVLSVASVSLWMEASNAGGLFAPAISWIALLPLAPLFLLPLVDAFVWFAQLVHTKTGWTAVPNSVGRRMCELMATAKKSKLPHLLTGAHITHRGVPLPSSTVQHRIPIRWPCRRRLGPPPA